MNNLSLKNINLNEYNFELPEDLQYIVASYIPLKKIVGCKIKYEQSNISNNNNIFITLESGSLPVFKNYISKIYNIIMDKDYLLKNKYGIWYYADYKLSNLFNSDSYGIEKIHEKKYMITNLNFGSFLTLFNELHPKKSYRLLHGENYESIIILFDIDDSKIRNQLRCVNKIFNNSIVKKN